MEQHEGRGDITRVGGFRWDGHFFVAMPARLCSARNRYGTKWGVVSTWFFDWVFIAKLIYRSKYPLATVNALLTAFGPNLGIGYDIGCQFKKTVAKSQLHELASNLNYKSLVGSFHGHAHNRLCQLSHLATYVEGLGLEDLEGCERFFSKSNALARSIRYATTFHRQQSIVLFLEHMDNFETYANLSKPSFLLLYAISLYAIILQAGFLSITTNRQRRYWGASRHFAQRWKLKGFQTQVFLVIG